jgi:hypothetical protein
MRRLHLFATVGLLMSGVALMIAPARAQAPDGSDRASRAAPALPGGDVARYVVTYMNSDTFTSPRTATVISITNNSSATCRTSVDWKVGFLGVACTTVLTLAPGQTGEHCSRPLSTGDLVCNATCSPALTAIEGNAIVGSTNNGACAAIALEGRTFYTTGSTDATLNAISQSKVVKVRTGNAGD